MRQSKLSCSEPERTERPRSSPLQKTDKLRESEGGLREKHEGPKGRDNLPGRPGHSALMRKDRPRESEEGLKEKHDGPKEKGNLLKQRDSHKPRK